MQALVQDLRFGVRSLARSPAFAIVTVLCLGLGIGANSTMFSAVNAFLIRPLPVAAPDDIVRVLYSDGTWGTRRNFAYPDYLDYRRAGAGTVALTATDGVSAVLDVAGFRTRVAGEIVGPDYMRVLGIEPYLGRGFVQSEYREPDAHPVLVVSHELFERVFDSDPEVVGTVVELNDRPFSIVGVAPPEFGGNNFAFAVDFWTPLTMRNAFEDGGDWFRNRESRAFQLIGRLEPGATRAEAQARLATAATELERDFPDTRAGATVRVLPERAGLLTPDAPRLTYLAGLLAMAVVGLVLLVACGNVANLLLTRAAARQHEIGVRLAMGASRARLVRQLVTEGFVLAIPAGGVGLLAAAWATDVFTVFMPELSIPVRLTIDFSPDRTVAAFTFAVSALAALLAGLTPALRASRTDLVPLLKDGVAGGQPLQQRDAFRAVVVVQLALSLSILLVAGLLLRTMVAYQTVDPGFDIDNGVVVTATLDRQEYPEPEGRRFFDDLLGRALQLPNVEAAALVGSVPLGSIPARVRIRGWSPGAEEGFTASVNVVGPGYFRSIGIPLLAGRDFSPTDRPSSKPVAIVNETLARRRWPDRDAVGASFTVPGSDDEIEVVGVVADSRYTAFAEEQQAHFYYPFGQHYRSTMSVHARVAGDPSPVAQLLRQQALSIDPRLLQIDARTLIEVAAADRWAARTAATLAASLAAFVVSLAAIGLYGVLGFLVSRRRREIGIRIALGASRGDVVRLVMREGLTLAILGGSLGLLGSIALGRLIGGFLFGVSATDPTTYVAAILVLGSVAGLAAYLPARRATRLDPIGSMREL